jgi:very-short-patch-repair endonuclease
VSNTVVRGWLSEGRLLRLHRSVFAVGHEALGMEGRMLAAVLACGPGAVLSHRSAAVLWGVLERWAGPPEVTITRQAGRRDRRISIRRVRVLEESDVAAQRGIPVTSPPRTLLDLAGVASPYLLQRALAQAEVLALTSDHELRAILARSNGRRGAAALRLALKEDAAFTRSALERRMLALCDRYDLPRPRVNTIVEGYEVDFHWPRAHLVVEVDGYRFHRARHAFEADRRRDAELLLAGIRTLRITHRRLAEDETRVVASLRRLLT